MNIIKKNWKFVIFCIIFLALVGLAIWRYNKPEDNVESQYLKITVTKPQTDYDFSKEEIISSEENGYFDGNFERAYLAGNEELEAKSYLYLANIVKENTREVLVWYVDINLSRITIDAKTGEIIDTHFFNGVYVD